MNSTRKADQFVPKETPENDDLFVFRDWITRKMARITGSQLVTWLNSVLGFAKLGHRHTIAEVDNLQGTLDGLSTTVSGHGAKITTNEQAIAALQALVNGTDLNLDSVAEIVDYIKANRSTIESITTSKVSVTAVYNALDQAAAGYVLDARQGKALYDLVVALQNALGNKVDKVAGKQLSTEDFTSAEKQKLAGLDGPHWKGSYTSLLALQAAHPSAVAGDEAEVDNPGSDVQRYVWDATDSKWVVQQGASTSETAASIKTKYESNADTNAFTDAEKAKLGGVEANATNWTSAKTIGSTLTGYAVAAVSSLVAAGDTILVALGKLQKQINDIVSGFQQKARETTIGSTGTANLTLDRDTFVAISGEQLTGNLTINFSGGVKGVEVVIGPVKGNGSAGVLLSSSYVNEGTKSFKTALGASTTLWVRVGQDSLGAIKYYYQWV